MAETRGKVVVGLVRFLKSTAPEGALERVLQRCPGVADLYRRPINPVLWYPIEALLDPLEETVRLYHGGKPEGFVAFGDWAAHHDFQRHYSFLAGSNLQPSELIKSADLVWPDNYRNAGTTLTRDMEHPGSLTEIDFPEMRHSHCLLMEGWSNRFAQLALPAWTISTRLEGCRHSGMPSARYASRWELRKSDAPAKGADAAALPKQG